MTILFRTDAGTVMGMGHAMRCLALAQAARDAGHSCVFVMAEGMSVMEERLRGGQCDRVTLSAKPGSADDAKQTAHLAKEHAAQWVVVDGYQFDSAYQAVIKAAGLSLLFTDDYGHCDRYDADIVLNQNSYAPHHTEWYAGHSPATRLLLGCTYAMLRSEFLNCPRKKRTAAQETRVLVTLGGGDPRNATLQIVEALKLLDDLPIRATIVIGGANPHHAQIQKAAGEKMKVVVDASDMPQLMAEADCAIAAGGTTAYELAYMGVPACLTVLAENQRRVAEDLAERGVIQLLDHPADTPPEQTAGTLRTFLRDTEEMAKRSERGRALVDGKGTQRVLAAMEGSPLASPALRLRPVTAEDGRLLWEWVNDPVVRSSSFSPDPIAWPAHERWLKEKLASPRCRMFLARDAHDVPVGQIRFDITDGEAVTDIHVAPSERGKGYGTLLITEGMKALYAEMHIPVIHAFIKTTNGASYKAFLRAGFTEWKKETMHGTEVYHLVSDQS
ncbi:MAG: UDP-2,4-diacetamido-2,4,6-trideoxy-beta-L-altropyranose hydrolase [Candidatus Peribacteraceae bacterium]|nr:UDP-2,4-diacetamido-2,4,6-trideoxy-beta-L-altropyranose hydrolase [Candidatus Peribacteraceae bacterium]